MPAGLEIYDESGKLQISDSILTYVLRQTGVAYTTNYKVGNTSYTSLTIPGTQSYVNNFVAVQGQYPIGFVGSRSDTGQRVFATGDPSVAGYAPLNTPYNYFIFQRSDFIPSGNFGLEIKNDQNQITFSSNQRTMQVIGYFEYNDTANIVNAGTQFSNPSKSLAFAQGAFAGHRIAGSLDYYLGGQVVLPSSQGGDPGADYQYGYQNWGEVYGCFNPEGDVTKINTATVSYDNVYIGPSSDPSQPPDWDIPLKCFVIDVTGIPIGVQFF